MDFEAEYDILKDKVEQALDEFFKKEIKAAANNESIVNIRNACLNKGKRIRPISFIAGYGAIKGDHGEGVVDAACSLEILHAYFLIHDDIMDQDRIRRNKDTLHIVYQKKLGDSGLPPAQAIRGGENLAILDGDICCALAKCQEMAESYVTKAQRVLQTNTNLLNGEFLSSLADYVINRTR